jgi:uncharacterized protein (TIGR02271 family)
METAENPVVIGVFRDNRLAEDAIAELRHAGFRDDQIRQARHEGSSLLNQFMNKLAGHEDSSGHLTDTLVAMGAPPEEATYYQYEYDQGHTVVAVESDGHQQVAKEILSRFGAYGVHTAQQLEQVQTIPLKREVLVPQKRLVETGQISIRKVVVTEEKTITVSVAREEVIIERHPVAGTTPATSDTLDEKIVELAEGETIRIPLRQEQVVIEKRPVVAEELIVGKKKVEETKHFTETVLREEPSVERVGNVRVQSSNVNVEDLQPDVSTPQADS